MTPEAQARQQIDRMLEEAGWAVQNLAQYDPGVPQRGIAVREAGFDKGEADYLLVVDRQAVGIIEAKPEGTTLGGVADQSQRYLAGELKEIPAAQEPLPFAYESTGAETYFREWLSKFAYHVDISFGMFIAAAVLAVAIAWLTVSYQAIKAALADPVKSIRYE